MSLPYATVRFANAPGETSPGHQATRQPTINQRVQSGEPLVLQTLQGDPRSTKEVITIDDFEVGARIMVRVKGKEKVVWKR